MTVLLVLPAILSLLLLCAHLIRSGLIVFLPLLLPLLALLLVPRGWVARIWQGVLALAALEWVRSAVFLVAERQREGEPWVRPMVILLAVAALAFIAALLFESRRLLEAYPRQPLM